MGRFLNEQDIIEKNISKYIERTSSEYSRFIEGNATFVTYYHQDIIKSTYDPGLENIERDIGRDSPVKYKKIYNFPLFSLSELSLDLAIEDQGLDTNYESSATIIPGTIVPLPEDFFTISYLGKIYLFKVNKSSPDAIKSKPYYKIDFNFSRIIEEGLELEDQVGTEYNFIYKNIGTDHKTVLEKSAYYTMDYMNQLLNKLIVHYTKSFFDIRINSIIFKHLGNCHYNMYLNKFINNNDLLKQDKEFLSTIKMYNTFEEDLGFYEIYRHTIFSVLEKQYSGESIYPYLFPMRINKKHKQFSFYQDDYYIFEYLESPTNILAINMFPDNFLQRLIIYQPYLDNNHTIENMIIRYVHNDLVIDDRLLDQINRLDICDSHLCTDLYRYVFEIILIYILKKERDKLLIKL